ncbi:hypothetical protein [uncultured Croceicoccus sp.]|jgi:hypothetical protein|uniref:hypothetical protein n=1 Tax=uncultured Croceicoccus sp. TaxID=1295329 RepID=UPI0026305753|nr:hypothetical protein [uncultured Croceicoccus sp.]
MPLRITMHRHNQELIECVCLGDLAEAIAVAREARNVEGYIAVQVWSPDGKLLHEDGELG